MKFTLQNIILVFILIVGFFLLWHTIQTNNKSGHVIVITDTRFIPEKINIRPGETVTWINTGTRKHWPASDNHATHSNYPQTSESDCLGSFFDVCKGLNSGEKWSFAFAFDGKWTYHDHIFPELTGTIFVGEENNNPPYSFIFNFNTKNIYFSSNIESLISYIKSAFTPPKKEEFYLLSKEEQAGYIIDLSTQFPRKAWEYLNFVGFQNGKQIIDGHVLSHIVGGAFYNTYGISGIKECTGTFGYGCYHGAIEELANDDTNDVTEVENVCSEVFTENPQLIIRCIHGIASVLLLETNFNITDALTKCDVLSPTNKTYCFDGVFLEYPYFVSSEKLNENSLRNNMCTNLQGGQYDRCISFKNDIIQQIFGSNSPK